MDLRFGGWRLEAGDWRTSNSNILQISLTVGGGRRVDRWWIPTGNGKRDVCWYYDTIWAIDGGVWYIFFTNFLLVSRGKHFAARRTRSLICNFVGRMCHGLKHWTLNKMCASSASLSSSLSPIILYFWIQELRMVAIFKFLFIPCKMLLYINCVATSPMKQINKK